MQITFVRMGQGRQTLDVDEGTTIADLKSMLDLNPELEIRMGGVAANPEDVLRDGQTVVATSAVKGGF